MFLYRGSSRGMGGSPEDLGLLAVAGPQTYCGTLGQPAVCSCCQSPHGFPELPVLFFPAVLRAANGKPERAVCHVQ